MREKISFFVFLLVSTKLLVISLPYIQIQWYIDQNKDSQMSMNELMEYITEETSTVDTVKSKMSSLVIEFDFFQIHINLS